MANCYANPGAAALDATPGADDGLVDLAVTVPATWGDGAAPGDGAGTAGKFEWWNAVDGWQLLDDTPASGTYHVVLGPELYGTDASVRVRAVSDEGRTGVATTDLVHVPGTQQVLEFVTNVMAQVTNATVDVTEWVEV